jgi:DNA-binding transcriptional LysR family regulator
MNFRTLDLNLLKVFDVLMVERNVTRAAGRLAMTQPAVSNALRRLRESTREDLFVSTPTGMIPTPSAEALWPVVRASLDGLRDAFEPQGFDPRVDARSFALAMADATAALFVPRLVEALDDEQSLVDLNVVPLATRDPRQLLEQGLADIALGFFPDVAAQLAADGDSGVIRREALYQCRYVCVMRRGHPLAQPGALTLDAYCAARHLRVSMAGRPGSLIGEALSRLGRQRRVMITVNQFFNAGSVVHRSDLLTALPLSFVPATGFEAQLVTRELPFELPPIDVSLLWHRRNEQDTAQRWLREVLVKAAADIAGSLANRVEGSRVAT